MIEHVFAIADFPVDFEHGGRVMVRKGTHWPAQDPVVQRYPDRFSDDPRWGMQYTREPTGYDEPPVEQATAAPGEKRNTRRSA